MEKEIDMKVITGLTRVRWHSAAGILEGTVKRIDTAKNAAGDWIDWFIIDVDNTRRGHTTRIPVTSFPSLKLTTI
jgi:hypothetical protein